jgi:MFS family permease
MELLRVTSFLLLLIAMGLFVRDFAKANNIGREEGMYFRYFNIGALLGPLTAGFLAALAHSSEPVFAIASLIMLCALVYFYHLHVVTKHPAYHHEHSGKSANIFSPSFLANQMRSFFSSSGRTKAFFVKFGMMSWIAFKHLYIPLYVLTTPYTTTVTGLILGLSLVANILLEMKVGEYGDSHGVRIPISIGFLIIGVLLICVFLSPFYLLNFVLLILISLGVSLIEPLEESLLFKNLPKSEEEKLYGVYMTAESLPYFFVPLIGSFILAAMTFKSLFIIFGGLFLLGSLLAFIKLKNL